MKKRIRKGESLGVISALTKQALVSEPKWGSPFFNLYFPKTEIYFKNTSMAEINNFKNVDNFFVLLYNYS